MTHPLSHPARPAQPQQQRTPPPLSNAELERDIVAACMMAPEDELPDVRSSCSLGDFFHSRYREIYEAILAVADKAGGGPQYVNVTSVHHELRQRGIRSESHHLIAMVRELPTSRGALYNARELRKLAERRRLYAAGHAIAESAARGHVPAEKAQALVGGSATAPQRKGGLGI